MPYIRVWMLIGLVFLVAVAGCSQAPAGSGVARTPAVQLNVLAAETFLADIAQNVAGTRLRVEALLPIGVDPHAFEPTPADAAKIARCDVLIVNGAGVESFLQKLLQQAGGHQRLIEASAGLVSRTPREGEQVEGADAAGQGDPHFWLDPIQVVRYVENIRDGLIAADPDGRAVYTANADAYTVQLQELDRWIAGQVQQIPPQNRLLVTNHESLGYYADRYGFKVIGTVVPSVSSSASPSAQQLARLIDHIKSVGARAIFLETGANSQLAQQVARDAGVTVVTEIYTHSITDARGAAPTYLAMLRDNTQTIVAALK